MPSTLLVNPGLHLIVGVCALHSGDCDSVGTLPLAFLLLEPECLRSRQSQ